VVSDWTARRWYHTLWITPPSTHTLWTCRTLLITDKTVRDVFPEDHQRKTSSSVCKVFSSHSFTSSNYHGFALRFCLQLQWQFWVDTPVWLSCSKSSLLSAAERRRLKHNRLKCCSLLLTLFMEMEFFCPSGVSVSDFRRDAVGVFKTKTKNTTEIWFQFVDRTRIFWSCKSGLALIVTHFFARCDIELTGKCREGQDSQSPRQREFTKKIVLHRMRWRHWSLCWWYGCQGWLARLAQHWAFPSLPTALCYWQHKYKHTCKSQTINQPKNHDACSFSFLVFLPFYTNHEENYD